jgi:phage terminase large subunit GpA
MDGEITSGRMQKLLGVNKVALMTLTRRLRPGRKPSTTNTSLRAITVGCDLADDRIASVVGHGNTKTLCSTTSSYGGAAGQRDPVWTELDELWRSRWKHPKGGTLKVDASNCLGCHGAPEAIVLQRFCSPLPAWLIGSFLECPSASPLAQWR